MNYARPHQVEAAKSILGALTERKQRILVVMPMGTGRVAVVQIVIQELLGSGMSITILAQRRAEIEQVKRRVETEHRGLSQGSIQFRTAAQLVDQRRESSASLAGHVVIAINSSFSSSFAENTKVARALSSALTIVGFTSFMTAQEALVYGNPVYKLSFPEALRQHIIPPFSFNHFTDLALGQNPRDAEVDRVLSELNERLGDGKSVFVCTYKSTLHAVYARLQAIAPREITVKRMSSDDHAVDIGNARNADWIVASPSLLATYHVAEVRNVVLLNQHHNFESLLKAVQCVFGQPNACVWDMGGNLELWKRLTSDIEEIFVNLEHNVEGAVTAETSTVQKWIRPRADGAASRDLMDRDRLIHVLRGIIKSKSDERSLAIGLFGRWGSGKSTVVNLLRSQLSGTSDTVFIEFNAWENEHVGSMPAALADAITQQIYQQRKALDRFWLQLKHRSLVNEFMLSFILVLLLGLLLTMVPIPKIDDKYEFSGLIFISQEMRNLLTVLLTVFFAIQLAWKSPVMQGIRSLLRQIGYAEHIGLSLRLREDLAKLFRATRTRIRDLLPPGIKKWLGIVPIKPATYVVIIDDLDRCSRQNVWNVVEATRLIAEFKDVVLVFAVDYRLLFDAIAERLHDKAAGDGERERLSREFLAKILQLSVQLPEPSQASVARYIEKALFEGVDEVPRAADSFATEPMQTSESGEDIGEGEAQISDQMDTIFENEDEALEQSDEYIVSTPMQREVFQESAKAFKVTNPRTLLRLYNSLTLIKGMNFDVGEVEYEYRRHAFYVFLTELCAIHNCPMISFEGLNAQPPGVLAPELWGSVRAYADRHGISAASQRDLNWVAEQRARTTSLPIVALQS